MKHTGKYGINVSTGVEEEHDASDACCFFRRILSQSLSPRDPMVKDKLDLKVAK